METIEDREEFAGEFPGMDTSPWDHEPSGGPGSHPGERERADTPPEKIGPPGGHALPVPKSDFEVFTDLVRVLHDVFSRPDPLDTVAARPGFRGEVLDHYQRAFGPAYGGLLEPTAGHLRWFRRMEPMLRIRRGSTVLDHGGGYGLNSLLLAALGYPVIFYADRLSHIAVSEFLKSKLEPVTGALPMRSILADGSSASGNPPSETRKPAHPPKEREGAGDSHAGSEPFGRIDAIVVEDTNGELAGVRPLLARCRRVLDRHGHFFVIATNCGLGRGMRRWRTMVREAGFRPIREYSICSRWLRSERDFRSSWRGLIEASPGVRALAASDQVLHFAK